MMKSELKILFLSYIYPPDAGSGTFRSLYFANHLSIQGHNVTVLTLDIESFHETAAFDSELTSQIESSVTVERTRAFRMLDWLQPFKGMVGGVGQSSCVKPPPLSQGNSITSYVSHSKTVWTQIKDFITHLLSCPDIHVGWIPSAVIRGRTLVKKLDVDCIVATGGPWSCLLAAAFLKQVTGIPLVTDFRDPWFSNPNILSKPSLFRSIERWLEKYVIKRSDHVLANSKELEDDFLNRYTFLTPERISTITNGFENVNIGIPTDNPSGNTNIFELVHVGALYMSRNPVNVLKAVDQLVADGAIHKDKICLRFIGGISVQDPVVDLLISKLNLLKSIEVYPRVAHREALEFQKNATVLLLIQPGFPLQIPRKLYEYISFGKPILSICDKGGATSNLVTNYQLGSVVENDCDSIKEELLSLYIEWENGDLIGPKSNTLNLFENCHLAGRLEAIVNKTIKGRR